MKFILFLSLSFLLTACNQETISYKEISKRTQTSKEMVKNFGGQLKAKLQAAMKSGDPIAAMLVCNEQAPLIAKQLSEASGWQISRTSLKARATKPDVWEKTIMQSFEQRHSDGDKFNSLFNQDIIEVKGKPVFRFMQAIETKGVCLVCHGENIATPIAVKIAELYPNDEAAGFKLGDIRGAFSIIQPLNLN